MSATPQNALSAQARRRDRLLWLKSPQVLSKELVIAVLNSAAQTADLLNPCMRHRRRRSPTRRTKAQVVHARRPKHGNRHGGRRARRPSGLNCTPQQGRPRTIATLWPRSVLTTTVATSGIGPFRVGHPTAAPHSRIVRRDMSQKARRVRVRCPVEVHTLVLEANFVLVGLIDRHAHVSHITCLVVSPNHVLHENAPRKHLHGPANVAVYFVYSLAVRCVP